MTHWDHTPAVGLATFLTLEDITRAGSAFYPTDPDENGEPRFSLPHAQREFAETPVLKLIREARNKGYETICLPLTTEKWKERWEGMCLLPGVPAPELGVTESRESGSDRPEGEAAQAVGTEVSEDCDIERKKRERAEAAEQWRVRPAYLMDEVTITRLDEADGVVVMISDWLELDAEDDGIRHDAEIALKQELAYASYLNIHTAILPAPRNRSHAASYARIINNCLKNTPYIYLSVRLPIYNPTILQTQAIPSFPTGSSSGSPGLGLSPGGILPTPPLPSLVISPDATSSPTSSGISSESEMNATWEMWDLIRSICDYNTRLTLTLDLTPPLPTKLGVLSKWAAESVRYIFLPASTFIANTKGYPVLPKPTQCFIRDSMIHRPTVIFAGANANKHLRGGEAAYSQYIQFLEKTSPAVRNAQKAGSVENFAQGYQDYLQAPLQPLMDNLQSMTYQTFEQDPVKYERYEEAIFRALAEWPASERVVCCVAGAGRGPLVARCLSAINRSRRDVFVYAVEKNPNAYVTLQQRKQREWGDRVQLLFGDMRSLDIPELVDILISELLGSFGDNELSPECLDGAQRFLKSTGISIPSSYTAHLAPLSSSKLYNEARVTKNTESLETPYVVMFQAVNILSGEKPDPNGQCGSQIQECWQFEHPRRNAVLDARGIPLTNNHNVRSARLRFWIPHAGVLHGLAGYFEAVLYGNIGLSIHPHRKDQIAKDMLSWFPLFFPFKEPLYLPSNSELQVSIWRLTNERQVWYEWHAESFLTIPITPGSRDDLSSLQPASGISQGLASPLNMPSPLADDESFFSTNNRSPAQPQHHQQPSRSMTLSGLGHEVIKIGHTSLHNPGGRSSWIGL
ncbi:PRMT5-domain-containing protein [Macrolepiota fuliginosa MF-IS2]|uniref:PRMT5-domain-containing protein n=1 Tax=Macrolepiota fuliginosa MF-IS2 TaxID=1400762 RepID=A0A9P5XGL9_9AGAR|nr:PRMT5-domain-containing protein [Macrolepiota fuliginosa MF-IS2]